VKPGPEADRVLLAHMRDCLDRILDYTNAERARFFASRLVQDAVIRNQLNGVGIAGPDWKSQALQLRFFPVRLAW
jgi:hypothetical protein